jgi:hypothetical protein
MHFKEDMHSYMYYTISRINIYICEGFTVVVMVFNAFNNIAVTNISLRSVLLVEVTGKPG